MHDAMAAIEAAASIGELPLLYLHGEDDQLVPLGPSRAGLEAIRGEATEVITYPGARHEIFNETNRGQVLRSEEHTSELQSRGHLVCRLLLEKKKKLNYV